MYNYSITSDCARHQQYIDALHSSQDKYITIVRLIDIICDFIVDPSISFKNSADLEFFSHLIFDTSLGKIHYTFTSYCLNSMSSHYNEFKELNNQKIDLIVKYSEFIEQISSLMMYDLYINIIRKWEDNPPIIESFLTALPNNKRMGFVECIQQYAPKIISNSPKLKLYILFS
jgi:hypothetical protein